MNASAEAIGAAIADIDNDEVAAAAKGLQDGFVGIAEATKAVLIDGDVSKAAEMEELGTSFQESFATFQELCVQELSRAARITIGTLSQRRSVNSSFTMSEGARQIRGLCRDRSGHTDRRR